MSAPKVYVFRDPLPPGYPYDPNVWTYRCCSTGRDECLFGTYHRTQQEALTAGLLHLATEHHPDRVTWFPAGEEPVVPRPVPVAGGYSRRCGVHVAACAALECRCQESPRDIPTVREKPAQPFDQSADCAHCDMTSADCDLQLSAGCCSACTATGGCTHQPTDPIQRAHRANGARA